MRLSTISATSILTALTLAATPAFAIEATIYKGTIGKIPVILEMSDASDTDQFVARYAYMSRGVDIPLHGRIDDNGELAIEEEAPCEESICRKADGDFVEAPPIGADWLLSKKDRLGNTLTGTWKDRKSGKSLVVTLERVGARTLADGANTVDYLDPVSAVSGWADVKITSDLLPYDMLKLDYPLKQGPETKFEGATIRMDTDPRTETSYPTIVKLPGAEATAINGWLKQQWLQFQFNPHYCLSTAYLGLGWSGSGGQGTTGLDSAEVTLEYLTPRLLGLVENSGSYCGGAHPNHIEERHFADVKTGEPVDAGRLLKGWVPKDFDGEEIDPAKVIDENQQRYGPNAELVDFVNARRDKSDTTLENDCGMNDLVASNLGVYFMKDELVFNLKGLPHVSFACTNDLVRIPLKDARPLLTEQGAYYLGLKD